MATTKPDRDGTPITFLVRARPAAAMRGAPVPPAQGHQRLEAVPGQHVVRLVVAAPDGQSLELVLAPEHARDLLLSQAGGPASRSSGSGQDPAVVVPPVARWAEGAAPAAPARGLFGDLAGELTFKALEVVGVTPAASAAALRDLIDGGVDEGVYRLQPDRLEPLRGAAKAPLDPTTEPQLVLVHGTFSSTDGTFRGWWRDHPELVRRVFGEYGGRVFGLDHRTLGHSPIDNALTLARALPDHAVIDLVTHSRGGLVADVLARCCAGLDAEDLAHFDGAPHARQRRQLTQLSRLLAGRGIQVRRVVRVACPLHGTWLASGRLDAYFSVLRWLLQRAEIPLLPRAVAFLDEVARRRADPRDFPGLEAMLPEGPMARWLASPRQLPGQLRVVAGDTDPGLLDNWVRGLLAVAVVPLFMQDNDLVVHTAAMYGGATRTGGMQFRLLRGGEVDHMNYFGRAESAAVVAQALLEDEPAGFRPIGPLSQAGQSSAGVRAARAPRAPDPGKPAVIVVPGIMGSHLDSASGREWFAAWRLPGVVRRIAMDRQLEPGGALEDTYGALMDHLQRSHEVIEFSYDWRKPIEQAGERLAGAIRKALAARGANGPAVRILAHSMGGLVTRAVAANHPDVWRDLMARDGARIVMLGTPNQGSWAPMQVLTGDDRLTRLLASVGGWFRDKWARERFAEFTGLLQMQAGLEEPALQLGLRSRWQQLAEQDLAHARRGTAWHDPERLQPFYEWALPSQADLDRARQFWRTLATAREDLAAAAPKMAIVLGQARATPCGLQVDGDVAYEFTSEGDGRVPWSSTCLPQVATWIVDIEHGDLPAKANAFAAYEDLLLNGDTEGLARYQPARGSRGRAGAAAPTWTARPRDEALGAMPPELDIVRAATGGTQGVPRPRRRGAAAPRLRVAVVHGDIRFTPHALMLGHYSALALTGSEQVVDQLLGGAMGDALRTGLYPDRPGEHMVFRNTRAVRDNPWALPRPRCVVVVGLGPDGDLKGRDLRATVRSGVLALLRQEAEARPAPGEGGPAPITLAITSVGSGGSLSVAESVEQSVQGVLEANQAAGKFAQAAPWPRIEALQVVELYADRAAEAWHALKQAETTGGLALLLAPGVSEGRQGLSQTMQLGYRGAGYDLVRVTQRTEAAGTRAGDDPLDSAGAARHGRSAPAVRTLAYSLFTRRARSELRAKGTQAGLVEALVAQAEGDSRTDRELARTLYQLLVPRELRSYLGDGSTLVLELDPRTAQYPWEMLDDGTAPDERPLALRMASVLRRLVIQDPPPLLSDSAVEGILVLGMSCVPAWRGEALAALPGVSAELDAVEAALAGPGLTVLRDPDVVAALKPTVTRPWKVMHLSGHGVQVEDGPSGMILADDILLSASEFASRDHLPELVFMNCCHLGKFQGRRGEFAANVAHQLIGMGVRCVVAAGWAVDDLAAAEFARGFYESLLAGQDFAAAVAAARLRAWTLRPECSTWAAYQCYGDAAWKLRPAAVGRKEVTQVQAAPVLATPQELLAHLEQVQVRARWADEQGRKSALDQLRKLAQAGEPVRGWLHQGRVAEAMARAWQELDDDPSAIGWYGKALQARDGGGSMKAREQWLILRARQEDIGLEECSEVLVELQELAERWPTAERWSLAGAAWQRYAVRFEGHPSTRDALRQMEVWYDWAEALDEPDACHPALQATLARLRLAWLGEGDPPGPERFEQLLRLLDRAEGDERQRGFRLAASRAQVEIFRQVAAGGFEPGLDPLNGLRDLRARVTGRVEWAAVRDAARFVAQGLAGTDARSRKLGDIVQLLAAYSEGRDA